MKLNKLGVSKTAFFKRKSAERGAKPWEPRPEIRGVLDAEVRRSDPHAGAEVPETVPFGTDDGIRDLLEKNPQHAPRKASFEDSSVDVPQPSWNVEGDSSALSTSFDEQKDLVAALSIHGGGSGSLRLSPQGNYGERALEPMMMDDEVGSTRLLQNRQTEQNPWNNRLGTVQEAPDGQVVTTADVGDSSLDIKKSLTFDTAVNLHALRDTRTEAQKASTVRVPRHLNSLFHKIMGWSKQLDELDDSTGVIEQGKAPDATPADPKLKMERMKTKMKYGVLMQDFENDQFALENNLRIAGQSFDRVFRKWEATALLDAPGEGLEELYQAKTSMIAHAMPFKPPKPGRDPCPGCGATMQSDDEGKFGFVTKQAIASWIARTQRKLAARSEYADRMAELKKHWDTHGKRVGEEWLDFMTEEEFAAIYDWEPRPMTCKRCSDLKTYGTAIPDSILPAEDFTEQLAALKEKKGVFVLVIDLADFPGSMVFDLPSLISMNNPVIIAANKLDCIMPKNFSYQGENATYKSMILGKTGLCNWVTELAVEFGLPRHRIKKVVPVSSRRGWNIHELAEAIEQFSYLNLGTNRSPLNTYFVGVTNVGKSSLLNELAVKLGPARKPHPDAVRQYFTEPNERGEEVVKAAWYVPPGRGEDEARPMKMRHAVKKKSLKLLTESSVPGTTVATHAIRVSYGGDSKKAFLYDTPGLYPHWQESSLLTLDQQVKMVQTKYRDFEKHLLFPGMTLHFTGMAAIDIVKGCEKGMFFAVYSSQFARHASTNTEFTDEFWQTQLGEKLYPPGSPDQLGGRRLSVQKSYLFECFSKHRRSPKADIYFCGLGWVSFFCYHPEDVVLRVRTVPGVVHGVRQPLRKRDMKPYKPWPKVPTIRRTIRTHQTKKKANTVVELTAGPYDPNGPPQEEVLNPFTPPDTLDSDVNFHKNRVERNAAEEIVKSTADPYEHIMGILRQQGKAE